MTEPTCDACEHDIERHDWLGCHEEGCICGETLEDLSEVAPQ